MKITAFAGSSSIHSINKQLVRYTLTFFPEAEINLLDLNDYEMPVFSVDREKQGYPQPAHDFLQHLKDADLLIVSLAEHNASYSAAFKNILDWCSRIEPNVFQEKPMLLMSTSPGGFGGGNVMNAAKTKFPKMGAKLIETFSLPKFEENFTPEKGILPEELKQEYLAKIKLVYERMNLEQA